MKKGLLFALAMMLAFIFVSNVKAAENQDGFSDFRFYANDVSITAEGGQWLGNFKTTDRLRFEIHSTQDKPIVELICGGDYGEKFYELSFSESEKVTDISKDFSEFTPFSPGSYWIQWSRYYLDTITNTMLNHVESFLFTVSEDGKYIANGAEITSVGIVDMYGNNFVELSKDKSNPTKIYDHSGSVMIVGNSALANKQLKIYPFINGIYREIIYPGIEATDSAGNLIGAIGTPGGIYNTPLAFKWVLYESSIELSSEPQGAVICESPEYYVEFVDVNNQYSTVRALVSAIILTENSLTITLKNGYTFDGCIFTLTDKVTGEKQTIDNMWGESTFKGVYTTSESGAVVLAFYDLQINKAHMYEFFIPTHSIFDSEWYYNTDANGGMYKTNAEWTTDLVVTPASGNLFPDVSEDNWASDYIKNMYARNIIEGYPEGDFRPQGLVTRSEFAKMMYLTLQIDKTHEYSGVIVDQPFFVDVKGDNWDYEYIKYVGRYMTGFQAPDGDVFFYGSQAAVREDMAVALVKAMGLSDNIVDENEIKAIFSDWESISPNLRKYVLIAYINKLIDGYPGGLFKPQQTITRAETSALLMKVWQSTAMEKVVFE